MTQDGSDEPGSNSKAAPAAPSKVADLSIDVVTGEAFLDTLRQTRPPEGLVVPFIRKPGPRTG